MRHLMLASVIHLCIGVWMLGANPFAGETSAPVTLLGQYAGWSAHTFSEYPVYAERSDVLDSLLPQWRSLKQALYAGESVSWLPSVAGGVPGLPSLLYSNFTPSYLAFLLVPPDWLGFYLAALVRLMLLGVGMYLFLGLSVRPPAALFGSLVFAYCGFNIAWFYWPHVHTSAWLPWLLFAVVGFWRYGGIRWMLGAAAAGLMLILGGFPSVIAFAVYATALYVLVALLTTNFRWHQCLSRLALLAAAGFAVLLLASPGLLSLVEMLDWAGIAARDPGGAMTLENDIARLFDPATIREPRVETTIFVGLPATVLVMLSPLAVIRRGNSRLTELALAGWLILLFAGLCIFGLLPGWLAAHLPGLAESAWIRTSILLGLAVAMLAACAIEVVDVVHSRRLFKVFTILCFVGLLVLQLVPQGQLFRQMNPPAAAEDFYPTTPAIRRVKENLGPFQSVVADYNYFVSGTLAAYGIREWFGHGFRQPEERRLLESLVPGAFVTPTAALFDSGQIDPASSLPEKLGIRFLMMGRGQADLLQLALDGDQVLVREQPDGPRKPAPPLPGNPVIAQRLVLTEPLEVSAVALLLATYNRPIAPADVLLEVMDANGSVMAQSVVASASVRDNQWALFRFAPGLMLPAGQTVLQLRLAQSGDGPLTAWMTEKSVHAADAVLIDGNWQPGALIHRFYASNTLATRTRVSAAWQRVVVMDPGVGLFEHLRTPEGPYFVRSLSADAAVEPDLVAVEEWSSGAGKLRYSGTAPGYVVLPQRTYPGWAVTVAGQMIDPVRYLDVLLAIPVPGPTEINLRFTGQPRGVAVLLTPAGLLLLFLLVLGIRLAADRRGKLVLFLMASLPVLSRAAGGWLPWIQSVTVDLQVLGLRGCMARYLALAAYTRRDDEVVYRRWLETQDQNPVAESPPIDVLIAQDADAAQMRATVDWLMSSSEVRDVFVIGHSQHWPVGVQRVEAVDEIYDALSRAGRSMLLIVAVPCELAAGMSRCVFEAADAGHDLVVFDHDELVEGQRCRPAFQPGYSAALVTDPHYAGVVGCHVAQLSASLDTATVASLAAAARSPRHLPVIAYHATGTTSWRPIDAVAPEGYVNLSTSDSDYPELYPVVAPEACRVSVIIPTRNRLDLLAPCIDSLRATRGELQIEIVVVDNQSDDAATLDYLAQEELVVVRADYPFNWAQLNNDGVAASSGDVVILLNNDTVALVHGVLDRLAWLASDPGIGTVGALLLYPDETIQHAGIVGGFGGVADHVYMGEPIAHRPRELFVSPLVRRDVIASTGACLAIRKSLYQSMGGLDESFRIAADVEFCFRVLGNGLRNVYEPAARLRHFESQTRERGLPAAEADALRLRFQDQFDGVDPWFNPAFSLSSRSPLLLS